MTSQCRVAVCLGAACIFVGASGCATRKYVRNQVAPLQNQIDRGAAEDKAQDAQIAQLADNSKSVGSGLLELSQVVKRQGALTSNLSEMMAGNRVAPTPPPPPPAPPVIPTAAPRERFSLDDYLPLGDSMMIHFATGSASLSPESKRVIDGFAVRALRQKGYLITVEGFTDSTGRADRNLTLSRSRAQNVVAYLISQHEIPVYRIYTAGIGSGKPADWRRAPASFAKNRRVEIRMYGAR